MEKYFRAMIFYEKYNFLKETNAFWHLQLFFLV